MATIQGSGRIDEDGGYNYTWTPITQADSGNAILLPAHFQDMSIQAFGTFGGGTVELQGSMDGVNFIKIQDWANADIQMTTTKIFRMNNLPKFVKPVATAGAGMSVTVQLHGEPV
jgi:hypothetical protein